MTRYAFLIDFNLSVECCAQHCQAFGVAFEVACSGACSPACSIATGYLISRTATISSTLRFIRHTQTFFVCQYLIGNKKRENHMKQAGFVVLMAAVLVVLLAGCVSSPEKGTSNQSVVVKETSNQSVPVNDSKTNVRYVQLNLLDGSQVGGIYVSETPAFTTIQYMYNFEPDYIEVTTEGGGSSTVECTKITNESGATIGFKNALINTMIDIENPALSIQMAQQCRKNALEEDNITRKKLGWAPRIRY